MTTNQATMALGELVEKGSEVDLRQMIQLIAQHLMDVDVERFVRCGPGRMHR